MEASIEKSRDSIPQNDSFYFCKAVKTRKNCPKIEQTGLVVGLLVQNILVS